MSPSELALLRVRFHNDGNNSFGFKYLIITDKIYLVTFLLYLDDNKKVLYSII
jgi:hypothetical protein